MTLHPPPVLAGHRLVVVDVEGNGQQPPEIVEIALLPLDQDKPTTVEDLRTWLVRPARPITALVTRKVHGITETDVAGSPPWGDVAGQVSAVVDGAVVVAHNASVEHRVLGAHLPTWQPPLVLDTLRLAKAVWPTLPGGYGLDNLITSAGLTPPGESAAGLRRHRAGYDAWMTAALLIALVEHGDLGWEQLTEAGRLPGSGPTDTEGGLW
ncbi:3'-5' exonuclease [Pseudonocardia lacus]|uniref:3'-5' exonuclease n=1 Tax=Pseudonocardia lacus TaxID=2835865 RepID=UPI001BDD5BEA|nr:3'-5' exonuclease [Pseudonocardia lacus]